MPDNGEEYIIEFYHVGGALKVTAIDPATGIEVSMPVSPKISRDEMIRLAVRKLKYVLAAKSDHSQ